MQDPYRMYANKKINGLLTIFNHLEKKKSIIRSQEIKRKLTIKLSDDDIWPNNL